MAVSLSPAFLDELRARTSLSALIGKTTKLQKAGREYRGCCPFHNEKTPSFYVNDDKSFYHCFGCSAHGDAIRWMTEQRGLPFIDAVKELAQAAGLEMPAQDRASVEKAERAKGLHEALADAAAWFAEQLNGLAGADARAVLARRGVSADTARAFALGFAPDSRGKLKTALKEYGDRLLIEAGLLIQIDGKEPYDRFRGRLMIPIRDPRGRVIAFGGRVIGEGEPKYLNSPDTPLFDKGRTLYNLDRAAPAARKADRVLVVEGYMDTIALAQAGIGEVVAPLGTALTEAQIERLWRTVDVPILCLDGDAAGQKAALRAAHRALPMLAPGKSLAFATLPEGQDPDDLVREKGPARFEELVAEAISLEEKLWNFELAAADVTTVAGRTGLLEALKRLAAAVINPSYQRTLQKALTDKYFDLFGLKRRLSPEQAKAINEAVAAANRHPRRELSYALRRSVLLGLMRHPIVITAVSEDLIRLRLHDKYLDDWRQLLVEIADEFPNISEDMVETIMSTTHVAPIEARCYTKDLAFSFYRRSSSSADAQRDLSKVIEILVDEHDTTVALRAAQQAFEHEMTEERFNDQTVRQQDAADCRARLSEWLEQTEEVEEAA